MSETTQDGKAVKKSRRGGVLLVGALIASHTCAGYIGDSMDFRKHYVTPVTDHIRGVERAQGFIDYQDVDLVSIINTSNEREVYLAARISDDHIQSVPVNEEGYAVWEGWWDRFGNYLERNTQRMMDSPVYDKANRLKRKGGLLLEKAELVFDYYAIKFKEVWNNIF